MFQAILDWVEHSPDERKTHLPSLIKKLDLESILDDAPELLEEKFRDGTMLSKDSECSKIFHKLCVRLAVEASICRKLRNEVGDALATSTAINNTSSSRTASSPTIFTPMEPEAMNNSEQGTDSLTSENNVDSESEPILPNMEDTEPENSPRTDSLDPGSPCCFLYSSTTSEYPVSKDSDEEVDEDDDDEVDEDDDDEVEDEDDDDEYMPTSRIVKMAGAPSTSRVSCNQLTGCDCSKTHHKLRKLTNKRVRQKSPPPELNANINEEVNEPKRVKINEPHVHLNEKIELEGKFLYPRFIKDVVCKSKKKKVLELYDFSVSKIERLFLYN